MKLSEIHYHHYLYKFIVKFHFSRHVLSATIRIYSHVSEVEIHYTNTLVGTTTVAKEWSTCTSGEAIVVDDIGTIEIKAYASKAGYVDSPISVKRYIIMDRCEVPKISPNGGTHAGNVEITLSSPTPSAIYCYSVSTLSETVASLLKIDDIISKCLDKGEATFKLSNVGKYKVKAWTTSTGMMKSPEVEATFTILAKVATPVIAPDLDDFTISATLFVHCDTINATMYYTTDGSTPTEMSLRIAKGESIVVDGAGPHTFKVFATEPSMLASDVAIKNFRILERVLPPQFDPSPGQYIGDVHLSFSCSGSSVADAVVYYTTDGVSTPNTQSKSVICGGTITLRAPGNYNIRAMATAAGKSPSSFQQGTYVLTRRKYDEYKISYIDNLFDIQPQVNVKVIEKDLKDRQSYCPLRNVRGRLATLKNPVGHFHILPPLGGCSSGQLQLPSSSGREFRPREGFNLSSFIARYSTSAEDGTGLFHLHEHMIHLLPPYLKKELVDRTAIPRDQLLQWKARYESVKDIGCQLVTNAGFFNTSNFHCLGDIISDGEILQSSSTHNVKFGIRNESFVIGYLDEEEVSDRDHPFDFLVTDLGWSVRGGQAYISESFSPTGDDEDQSMQSTGAQFASVLSARTAIGLSKSGHLMVLQVEGETWNRGMNLYEFAALAVELGFESAINLDGGGSVTMTQNHSLVSEPSWKCQETLGVADDDSRNQLSDPQNTLLRCEKKVASVTCMHAMSPPFVSEFWLRQAAAVSDNDPPTVSPTMTAPSEYPTLFPATMPTEVPSERYDYSLYLPTVAPVHKSLRSKAPVPAPHGWDNTPTGYGGGGGGADEKSDDWWTSVKDAAYGTTQGNSTAMHIVSLQKSLMLYQLSSMALLLCLALSLVAHCVMCMRSRRRKVRDDDEVYSSIAPADQLNGANIAEKALQMSSYNPQLPPAALHSQRNTGLMDTIPGLVSPPRSRDPSSSSSLADQSRGTSWKEKLSSLKLEDNNFYDDDDEEDDDEDDNDANNNVQRTLLKKAPQPAAPSTVSKLSSSFGIMSGKKGSKGSSSASGGGRQITQPQRHSDEEDETGNDDLSTIELYGSSGRNLASRKPLLSSRRELDAAVVVDSSRDRGGRDYESGRDGEKLSGKHSKTHGAKSKDSRSSSSNSKNKSSEGSSHPDNLSKRKKATPGIGPSAVSDYIGLSSGGEN